MSNGRRQLTDFEVVALPSILAPAVLIGIALYFLDDYFGMHNAITTVLFFGACFAAYRLVPNRLLYGFGLVVSALLVFVLVLGGTKDWLWAIFWTGLYAAFGWFCLKRVLEAEEYDGSDIGGEDDDEVEEIPAPRQSRGKNRTTQNDKRHKRVGFCQGWNVSATSKSSHDLYRCGNCGSPGCADRNCDRVNFSGTRCLSCGVDGGGFSR